MRAGRRFETSLACEMDGLGLRSNPSRKMAIYPLTDVQHDHFLIGVVQQVVKAALVELERLIGGSGRFVKMPAAAWLCVLIGSAVKDQERQCNQRKFLLQSLIGLNQRGHRLCRLRFMSDEWIVVHCLDNFGVARKAFVRQVEHMCVWCDMTQPLENGEGKVGRR
jgi:hypothetical protein